MMNRLARYAMGSVNFEVTGGRGERFLNDCVNAGVPVEHIRPTQTGYLATVPLRDYKRMHKYARRNRCRLRVREKYGAYFALFTYRHRWGILAGLVLCVLLLCMCRNLIWNICFYNLRRSRKHPPARSCLKRESMKVRFKTMRSWCARRANCLWGRKNTAGSR